MVIVCLEYIGIPGINISKILISMDIMMKHSMLYMLL